MNYRQSLTTRSGSPPPMPLQVGIPGPARSNGPANGRWSAQHRSASPMGCHRVIASPRNDTRQIRGTAESVPSPFYSHEPQTKLVEPIPSSPKAGDEPKFVEAVTNSLIAQINAADANDAQEEIAGIKKGIASLANRCEEILDLVKEMARELDTERKGRQSAIQEVQEQTRKHCEDLEHAIISQRGENSCRFDRELASVRSTAEAAMGEICSFKDRMLLSHPAMDAVAGLEEVEPMRHLLDTPAGASIDELVGVLNEERERENQRSAAMHVQRSWEEEAANIHDHIKRFQDTVSKTLSHERETRQRDMKMLLGTIDELHRQASSEAAAGGVGRRKPGRSITETYDSGGGSSVSDEVGTMQ